MANNLPIWFFDYFWIILVGIVIIAIILSFRHFSKLKYIFEGQAMKRKGKLQWNFRKPVLTFPYRDRNVIVSIYPGSKYQSAYTRVYTAVNNPGNHIIRIYGESWASEIGKKLGMQDIQIGSNEFDDKYMIKGDDEYFITRLLTWAVQDKLLSLRKHRPTVTLESNQFKINVPKILRTDEDYDLLLDTALAFVDRLVESQ